jgi:hypothetical protein
MTVEIQEGNLRRARVNASTLTERLKRRLRWLKARCVVMSLSDAGLPDLVVKNLPGAGGV